MGKRVPQGLLPFRVVAREAAKNVTAHAGLPLVLEVLHAMVARTVYKRLARALGGYGWRTVRRHLESLVLLSAAGGDCIDDLDILRADPGLERLVGFKLSSPTRINEFLHAFHQAEDGRRLTRRDDAVLSVAGQAHIRAEGPGLVTLAWMVGEIVRRQQDRHLSETVTLDVDATVVEAHKQTALKAYEGTVGYQPQMAWWAEQKLWVMDQFRDGNVPAEFEARSFIQQAFATVPPTAKVRRLRGDSALYNEEALTWANEHRVEFAVSADMSQALLAAAKRVEEATWQPYRADDAHEAAEERQWAEVPDFVPEWKMNRKKRGEPLRYIAIRVRSRQGELLAEDGERWRHFAIVTNMDWEGGRLLRWHRQKQGTVEQGHKIVKNELAGGTLPCGKFGANAAWWRIQVLTHGLLEMLKALALPQEFADLRPKAMRFRLLNVAATVARHAHELVVRLAATDTVANVYIAARGAIRALAHLCRAGPVAAT